MGKDTNKTPPVKVHELYDQGNVNKIFREFENKFDASVKYGYYDSNVGKRKAADTAQKNDKGEMLIHLMARDKNFEGVERALYFGKKYDINAKMKNGYSVIHCAINSNHLDTITRTVRAGANILGLTGGIKGLVDYATKPETKRFLASDGFKNIVEKHQVLAQDIIRSTPEKEKQRNSLDGNKGKQTRISGFYSAPNRGTERENPIQVRQHQMVPAPHAELSSPLALARPAFRSAASIYEQERQDLIQAVANSQQVNYPDGSRSSSASRDRASVSSSSSSSSSSRDGVSVSSSSSSSSSSRDGVSVSSSSSSSSSSRNGVSVFDSQTAEERDLQEALRRSVLSEYNVVSERGTSVLSNGSSSDSSRDDLVSSISASTTNNQIQRKSAGSIESGSEVDSTQATEIVPSQEVGQAAVRSSAFNSSFNYFSNVAAKRTSGFESDSDVESVQATAIVPSPQQIKTLNERRSKVRSSSEDSDGVTSDEGRSSDDGLDSSKRRSDALQGTPTRRNKRADHKRTPQKIKDKAPENDSFVERFAANNSVSAFPPLQRGQYSSNSEWVLTRRVNTVDRGTSPINF